MSVCAIVAGGTYLLGTVVTWLLFRPERKRLARRVKELEHDQKKMKVQRHVLMQHHD